MIALYVNGVNATFFDRFSVEYIPKKSKKFLRKKNIVTNIYKIQPIDMIMCEYFCIGLIDFMLKGKPLLDCTDFFSPNEYEKNDKIILAYFQ